MRYNAFAVASLEQPFTPTALRFNCPLLQPSFAPRQFSPSLAPVLSIELEGAVLVSTGTLDGPALSKVLSLDVLESHQHLLLDNLGLSPRHSFVGDDEVS